ncbi:MAG: phosphoribosylformylglycinamidine synthase I [Desulfobacterales bacterium]
MKPQVNVLVLTGYGLNCDHETAHAFELAGGNSSRVHINSLIDGSISLDNFHILVFGGGFSWGDDHGAGVVQAVRMKTTIGDHILRFIDSGNLVIGICNGFQTIVNLGLLPGFDKDYTSQSVALTYNDCGNFRDQWVHLNVNPESPCVFTKNISHIELPVRHGEGKFYSDEKTISRLKENNQIVLRYAKKDNTPATQEFPSNPNGSVFDIAGVCDPTGRIFGLMPHPEAFHHPTNHPDWTREKEHAQRKGETWRPSPIMGLHLFQNAVNFFHRS